MIGIGAFTVEARAPSHMLCGMVWTKKHTDGENREARRLQTSELCYRISSVWGAGLTAIGCPLVNRTWS